MTPRRPKKRRPVTATTALQHARDIADTSDRWFLSVAGALGRLGGWARREADIAADSAVSAFATTVKVARKLTDPALVRPARNRVGGEDDAAAHELNERLVGNDASRWSASDLMSAMPAAAWSESASHDGWTETRDEPSPPGVVPLLQALGRTVADHTRAGYATLEKDERFWTLIHLVQALGRPDIPDGSGAGPQSSLELVPASDPDRPTGSTRSEPRRKP